MLEDEGTKKILVRAFERMNELILELAEIERVTTQSFEPNFEYVMLEEVVQKSQDLLMAESGRVKLEFNNRALTTDVKLMALAIKNLLDNGLKYGQKKCVILRSNGQTIEVVSEGEKLQHPLTYYTEPFSQEEKRSSGFGLGLYIVHSILEKLGYQLGYRHEEGKNIFMIEEQKSCRI
jgi:two-component system, OmpR family, sensor kinase